MSEFRMSRLFNGELDLSLPFENSVAFYDLQRTVSASSTESAASPTDSVASITIDSAASITDSAASIRDSTASSTDSTTSIRNSTASITDSAASSADSAAPTTPQNWGGIGWDTYDTGSFVDSPATTYSDFSSCAPARLPPPPPTRKPTDDLDLEWPITTQAQAQTHSPAQPPATVSVPVRARSVADAYNDGCVSPLEELQRVLPRFPSFILPEPPATPEADVFPVARKPPVAHASKKSVQGRESVQCVAALQAMPSFDFWPQAPRASAMSSVSAPGSLEAPAELEGEQRVARARSAFVEKNSGVSRQPLVLDTRPDTLAGPAKEEQGRFGVSRPRQSVRQQPLASPGHASFAVSPRQAPPVPPKLSSYRPVSPPKPALGPGKETQQEPKRASTYVWAKLKQAAPSRSNTVSAPNPPRKNSVAAAVISGPRNFSRISPRTPEEGENPLLRQLSHLAEAEQRARARATETPGTVEAPRAPKVVLQPSLPLVEAVQLRAAPPRSKQLELLAAMPDVFVQPPTPTHPPPMEHPAPPSEQRGRRRDIEAEPSTPPRSADSSPAPKLGRKGSKYAHATSDRAIHPAYRTPSTSRSPSRSRKSSYKPPAYQPVRRDASPGGRGRENAFPVSPVRGPSRSASPSANRAVSPSPSPISRPGSRGDNTSSDSPRGNITNPSAWSTYQAMRNAERQGSTSSSSSYTSPQSARPAEVYKAYDSADTGLRMRVEDGRPRSRSGREADGEARRRSAVPGAMRSPGGDVRAVPEALRPRRGVMVGGT